MTTSWVMGLRIVASHTKLLDWELVVMSPLFETENVMVFSQWSSEFGFAVTSTTLVLGGTV